jgi:hypothetical protein
MLGLQYEITQKNVDLTYQDPSGCSATRGNIEVDIHVV